jgi:isoleucyl-tRNA synthetase
LEVICIVSALSVVRDAAAAADAPMEVRVDRAPGAKCPRCWNYRLDLGRSSAHPEVCGRCAEALAGR